MPITITGDVTPQNVAEALSKYFPDKVVRIELTANQICNDNEILISESNDIISNLEILLSQKDKSLKDLEATSAKALSSIQSFHKQQQSLFDEFVLLRQRYDEQKTSLLSTLWVHCGQYHPDLRLIPLIEDEGFVESDERIGNYSVGDFLGEGQFATVRTCWHVDRDGERIVDEEYAIKTIKKEKITTLQSLKRVSNEIEILKKLKSEFVVTIHDVIHTTNMLYIVTEKGGSDLFEFFDEHPEGVSEKWAREIITCILRAVHYCHEQSVCHRDLKPENILVKFDVETGRCIDLKLCDFGLSTKFIPKIPLTDFCGSPGFFAPEMITYSKYFGDKADVWSVGCILLELILGHEKFCNQWMTAYDYEVMQDKDQFTRDIADVVSKLPEALTFSEDLNEFVLMILKLRSSERPITKTICVHRWLEGVFEAEWSSLSPLDMTSPLSKFRCESFSTPGFTTPGVESGGGSHHAAPFIEISSRERHMIETENEKGGHHLHLPPIEPSTPSVGRARKFLAYDFSSKSSKNLLKSDSSPAVVSRESRSSDSILTNEKDERFPSSKHLLPPVNESVDPLDSLNCTAILSPPRNSTQSDRTDGEISVDENDKAPSTPLRSSRLPSPRGAHVP